MPGTSRHQRLVELVKLRFQGIRIARGYNSDMGLRVSVWRDLSAVNFQDAELPALNFRDRSADITQAMAQVQEQEITFEVDAVTKKHTEDKHARELLADIITAIGENRQWPDPENGDAILARDTLPKSWEISVQASGQNVSFVRYIFTVRLRTRNFDPYNAQ